MASLPLEIPTVQRSSSNESDQSFLFFSSPFNDKKRIIIFDWDDTFLPTSYLLSNPALLRTPYQQLPDQLRAQLQALERIVLNLIQKLIKLDNCYCYIVSNAMSNWILSSCQAFFPLLFQQVFRDLCPSTFDNVHAKSSGNDQKPAGLLYGENSSLMLYSACDLFARQCPNQGGLWKLFTFTYIADSKLLIPQIEREAAARCGGGGVTAQQVHRQSETTSPSKGRPNGRVQKWIKPETPRRENSKSESNSNSLVSDTLCCDQEDESEQTRTTFEEEEETLPIHDEEYEESFLPPLIETEFEHDVDRFDLEQIKDSALFDLMFEKTEWELISVGDAEYEATAALQVGCTVNSHPDLYRSVTTKVVKIPRLACVAGMIEQLTLLQRSLSKLLACEYSIFLDNFETLLKEDEE
ncbi:apicomplexan-conserved protein [Reticulomyxa filosa]|uniref:Apicomplexan-conserved protein n=1 Tax=Reticulomyxa filosa TaxID=46433 RepID=X6LXV3_RETFI|nr:apicomplexan-conserved protein [Reticulomyxa filosa]|eukprot:ETO06424.1 apicomplexan-conserved protein [Reticulomyxa filosa]